MKHTLNIMISKNVLYFMYFFSFDKGEIFVVHNDMGDGWLWVTSQSTGLSGIVNQELVQELVTDSHLFIHKINPLPVISRPWKSMVRI